MLRTLLLMSLLPMSVLPVMSFAQNAADAVAPEAAGAGAVVASDAANAAQALKADGKPVEAQNWMVAAANPLAVDAGARVLREGGTAADAMVAVQAVLGLVEPQSSGLGGGAFLVWYDGESGEVTTLDGRETAPLAATPRLFQTDDGEPMGFFDAVIGGRSVGTPGTPLLMKAAHDRWGRTEWSGLFKEGIALAETGFEVSPRLALAVGRDSMKLASHPTTANYFMPGGIQIAAGQTLKNPDYAESLRALSEGPGRFYAGDIARDIVAAVQSADNPGLLDFIDFAVYRVVEREAVCAPYRSHEVCGMGPPSSGALTVGQILGLLDGFDLASLGADSPEAWRLIGDASRLAFADRGRYMADSDFVPVPVKGLVDPAYLADRATLLAGEDALPEVSPGDPEFDHALHWADDTSLEFPSTSHISIVDQYGNALSMTTTIENGFGSRVMVRGFLLNNELTDFSFRSHEGGVPIANRVEPGKRPRSSMSPTIVLKDGKPVLIVGSPGGSRIIGYVVKTIIAHLDWGLNVQEAIDLGHLVNRFGTYDVESGTEAVDLMPALMEMGYEVTRRDLNSGIHAISVGEVLLGGADNRREGIALGE
ncbi:MAG: gamma-glutamyltransferase [Pseudomonadota bacterium]